VSHREPLTVKWKLRAHGGGIKAMVSGHGSISNLRPNKMQRQGTTPRTHRTKEINRTGPQIGPTLQLHLGYPGIHFSPLIPGKFGLQLQID
jgi:hypothetical protein